MNFFTLILFGLVSTAFGNDIISSEVEERITGGIVMEIDDLVRFNYQVGMYSSNTDSGITICGGALVHPQVVLTAAHCVEHTEYLALFMGTIIRPRSINSYGNIRVEADSIVVHEDYDSKTLDNDIAIIILPFAIKLNAYIGTIPLASYNKTDCESGRAWVSGWGRTNNEFGSNPEVMNYLEVVPMPFNECADYFDDMVEKRQLCSSGRVFEGICEGDSGGPYAFQQNYERRVLCGLNSFIGSDDCINNYPKAHTSVAYYHDNGWICKNCGGLIGC